MNNKLADAIKLVVADVRRSYPGDTVTEAVIHVRNTVHAGSLDRSILGLAYRTVLTADYEALMLTITAVRLADEAETAQVLAEAADMEAGDSEHYQG